MLTDLAVPRSHVVNTARSWLGTPWRHQGRARGLGCDCAGLVIGVAQELGLSRFDAHDYGRLPNADTLRRLCDAHMMRLHDRANALPGDVLLMRWAREPQHLALVTDVGIIHAYAAARRVVEHGMTEDWESRIVQAYRIPGVV